MKNNWDKYSESELNDLMKFADGYKDFISSCKTERECASFAKKMLNENGFKCICEYERLNPGDKVYYINKNKLSDTEVMYYFF